MLYFKNKKENRMKRYLVFILAIISLCVKAQTLDEEIGFKIVKAEYLINTERYEDAIKELNEVIKLNGNFKNALLLRAETKYKLAAYKGAKQDAIEYIALNGITAKSAALLGKADYSLNALDAALNSLSAAIALGEKDAKIFEIRAEIYESKNQKISACEDWQMAAKLGSTKGAINAKKSCGMKETPQEPAPTTTNTNPTHHEDSTPQETSTNTSNNTSSNGQTKIDTTQIQPGEGMTEGNRPSEADTKTNTTPPSNTNTTPPATTNTNSETGEGGNLIPNEDNTINSIVIDEELTLDIFGQGLGKRAIMERPSILILAEKDGVVTVEICVNKEGRIDFAEFVPSKSTLNQNSLVSLAIRKSKEFWFENSEYPKQCGFIAFKIKGS